MSQVQRLIPAAVFAALLLILSAASVAWGFGELSQKPGAAGCFSEDGSASGCQKGEALGGAAGVAVSPDGRNVYVTGFNSGSVAIFDRDPASGALSQKPAKAGCVSEDGSEGKCEDGKGLSGATGVAVSADGKSVYVAGAESDAVAVFARDPAGGGLAQLDGKAGCVSEDGSEEKCEDGKALDAPGGIGVSPDGRSVYVASSGSSGVASLDRDPASGALTQRLGGEEGCITDDGSQGTCRDGKGLSVAFGLAVSPDGQNVYVASIATAVAILDRDSEGKLSQSGAATGCISSDGSAGACQPARLIDRPIGVAVSPDGKDVYVAGIDPGGVTLAAAASSRSGAVSIFDRGADGTLAQRPGAAGCIAEGNALQSCQRGSGLSGADNVAVSPDNESVYVVASLPDQGGPPAGPPAADGGSVAVFDRDPRAGPSPRGPARPVASPMTGPTAARGVEP
jgi:DNA-binding beta-propeller fold protein YncE